MRTSKRRETSRRRVGRPLAWLGWATIVLAGCGAKDQKAVVNGTVTLDGVPLDSAEMRFASVGGQTPTAGATVASGKFVAELVPGSYVVEINAAKIVGKKKAYESPDSPTVNIVQELLPPRYNSKSELRLEVGPGEQEKTFELKSK
jgi:hypothetical protein